MLAKTNYSGNEEKLDAILNAAQKRLGLYGFKKTTMTEIAADVNLSKASLYYYFPDKESILKAVLQKEQDEYFSIVSRQLKTVQHPEALIREFVKLRHQYFTAFLNLTKFRFSDFFEIRPQFNDLISNYRERETEVFKKILDNGSRAGVFKVENTEETASIFLEIIHGLRLLVMRNRPIHELTKADFDLMNEKHQLFLEIFIKSIIK